MSPDNASARARTRFVVLGVACGLAALAVTIAPPPAHAGVIPPNAKPFGKSYGEWGAEWWQWAMSLPQDNHPLFDTADAGAGQPFRNLWFLGGTFTTVPIDEDDPDPNAVIGIADREITVPSGTALFFPIMNLVATDFEDPVTEEELREMALDAGDRRTVLFAEVDGEAVDDLDAFRVQSPLFTLGPAPDNNIFGVPQGAVGPAVDDGVYLMLTPLAVGEHTLHFGGTQQFTEEQDGFDFLFQLDISYDVTVAPRGRFAAVPAPSAAAVAMVLGALTVLRRRARRG